MHRQIIMLASVAGLVGFPALAQEEDLARWSRRCPSRRIRSSRGSSRWRRHRGSHEAKFEMEDGELMLSVYTSEAGLAVIPEENVFKEYKGPATETGWDPKVEVFEDFAHIARSAQYHTLLSMTDVTIPDIIEKASAEGDTVISVKAKVRDGRPVFEVYSAGDGAAEETLYDLMTGEPVD